ncbi:MAG TPA: hypothetical protein VMS88_00200 [Terriglobales bacterium]|nr:hypothetical protein [Terriglobales bacterium]
MRDVTGWPRARGRAARLLPAILGLLLSIGSIGASSGGPARAARSAPGPLDPRSARRVFHEARSIANRDRGRLWGASIAGPILLVDPGTRRVIANGRDVAGVLVRDHGVYVGRLPESLDVANTALDWNGTLWSMLLWPLPQRTVDRRILLAHELWHRVQSRLGLPSTLAGNAHLDAPEGRLWMRLEWHALAAAVSSGRAGRRAAIADALAFRAHRRSLFPAAANEENALELNEGMAEYTGVMIGVKRSGRRAAILDDLARAEQAPSYVRSFAYGSGPAYGWLLDEAAPGWRRDLVATSDLGVLLGAALQPPPALPSPDVLESRARRYGLDTLRAVEQTRERARLARLAADRARFVEGRVLAIPLHAPQVSFDPRSLQPLDTLGTVYPTLRVSDVWGILEVTSGGALLARDWSRVTVPAPADTTVARLLGGSLQDFVDRAGASPADTTRTRLHGDGWELNLEPGWWIVAGARPGDCAVGPMTLRRAR